jgi:hypothetical protein
MRSALASLGGLVAAPAAWAVNMELGQILPYLDCASQWSMTSAGTAIALVIAALAGFVSFRASATAVSKREIFISHLSSGSAAVFTFALILQGAASVLLNACQR